MKTEVLIPIFLSPLIGAIIAFLFSQFGITGKTRLLEYYLKRLELIEKLLSSKEIDIDRSILKKEVNEIIVFICLSSVKNEEIEQIEFVSRPWYKKIIHLPLQKTLSGKIASFIFYLYGVSGVLYIFILVSMFIGDNDEWYIALIGLVMSFLIAYLCRIWAIKSAYSRAILERAKRELFLNDKLLKITKDKE
jgi:hypothetical protein